MQERSNGGNCVEAGVAEVGQVLVPVPGRCVGASGQRRAFPLVFLTGGFPACGVAGMAFSDSRIVLRGIPHAGMADYVAVDHPGQPADYVHTDGTVWTWQARRVFILGGVRVRCYDLAGPSAGEGGQQ